MNDSAFSRVKAKVVTSIAKIRKFDYKIIKLNKKKKILLASLVVVVGLFAYRTLAVKNTQVLKQSGAGLEASNAYSVLFGDKEVGIVRNTQDVTDILLEVEKILYYKNGLDLLIDQDLTFASVYADDDSISLPNDIRSNIINNLSYEVYAYAIYINGEQFGALKSQELAYKLLEQVKEPFRRQAWEKGSEIEEIFIVEDVGIKKEKVPLSTISDFETMLALVQKGTTEEKTHIVERGDNYWNIAAKYNLSVNDLIKANPDKNYSLIHPGDELNLIVPKPYLTVATYENEIFTDKIQYGKEVQYTSSLYSDQRTVKKKGTYGEKQVFAKVLKHNGIEVDKEVMKEIVLSNPKSQIELQGTKKLPPKKGTGVFMRPTRGTLTSRFGMRWGRMHNGIDLASRTGTPIKAADGGVVTFAGWNGTYGLMVEIDHGAGFKTRYGHCSKLYVKVGEKVYKDKTIAAVGNTGRSTGPHVHFEVIKHGVPQNPLLYIDKKYR